MFSYPCTMLQKVSANKKAGWGQGRVLLKNTLKIISVTTKTHKVLQTHCIGTAQGLINETGFLKGNTFWIHYTLERGNSSLFFHKKVIDVCGLWAAITKTPKYILVHILCLKYFETRQNKFLMTKKDIRVNIDYVLRLEQTDKHREMAKTWCAVRNSLCRNTNLKNEPSFPPNDQRKNADRSPWLTGEYISICTGRKYTKMYGNCK